MKKGTFPYSETKRKERGTMRKMIVVLSLLLTVFIPTVSYSQDKGTKDLEDADKREALDIRNKLGENIKRLSLLSEDMKREYTSMSASQPENRFLIMNCRENVANTEGIYRYVVHGCTNSKGCGHTRHKTKRGFNRVNIPIGHFMQPSKSDFVSFVTAWSFS
jgi:hypothetical protein